MNTMISLVSAIAAVIAIVAVVFMMPGSENPESSQEETYDVSGYIKTGGTGLEGATVALDGQTTTTDENGYYSFTGLAGSTNYTITVAKTGYQSQTSNVQVNSQNVTVTEIDLKVETVSMPTANAKVAIETETGGSEADIYFIMPAAETDYYAVGAVIDSNKSVVGIYRDSTGEFTIENEYSATTTDQQAGMAILIEKQIISRFITNYDARIVPFNIVKTGTTYTFDYFDGYNGPVSQWGFGTGVIDETGNVPEDQMTHTWITAH